MVGTVFGTIIVAPLVAALAVGIGVPILLAYVYGVVPISLCRSGGCGVTTNNNGGVRFAFDDEPTTTVDNSASASYFNQANPSVPVYDLISSMFFLKKIFHLCISKRDLRILCLFNLFRNNSKSDIFVVL